MPYGLKSGFWVRATLRRLNQNGLIAAILHKGDEDAGAIFITLADRQGKVSILREDGSSWQRQNFQDNDTASAAMQVNDYLERQKKYDPDLWIIEIDVADSSHPLEKELSSRRFTADE